LIARPSQLSSLIRISLDAYIARCELLRVRRLLGPHFNLTDVVVPESASSHLVEDLPRLEVASADGCG
jgi:hypothetical protein